MVFWISRTVPNVCTLPSVMKTFMKLDKRWFLIYVAERLRSVKNCYFEQVLDDSSIELLGKPTEWYEAYEEVEKRGGVVGSNALKRYVENYCNAYYD